MKVEEYIQNRLNDLKSTKNEVGNFASNNELSDFIFKTIMSKKFRKFSINEKTKAGRELCRWDKLLQFSIAMLNDSQLKQEIHTIH